jgi:hypothetical protein
MEIALFVEVTSKKNELNMTIGVARTCSLLMMCLRESVDNAGRNTFKVKHLKD